MRKMDRAADTHSASSDGQSPSEPSRLCHACLSVLTRSNFQKQRCYPHHGSLKSFINASFTKCYICSWLLSILPKGYQEDLRLLAEGRISNNMIAGDIIVDILTSPQTSLRQSLEVGQTLLKWDSRTSFTGMKIEHSMSSAGEVKVVVHLDPLYRGYFPLNTTVYDCWLMDLWVEVEERISFESKNNQVLINQEVLTGLGMQTRLPSNTGSADTWLTVMKWIQDCSKNHRCMDRVNANWCPTRLVQKLPYETFRVVRSDSIKFPTGSDRRYITLSHRWGDGDFLKLTTDNISTLSKGLPVARLRKTFQETLIIAQRMKISYVWIDSLCIIQSGDDQADWRQESKMMERVYSNSFCNLSADWGDELNGLFFERKRNSNDIYGPPIHWTPANLQGNYNKPAWFRRMLTPKPVVSCWQPVRHLGELFEDVTCSPLNHRGWVLQERLLAPRVLHFSPQQVTWECAESLAWEHAPAFLGKLRDDLYQSSIWLAYSKAKRCMQRLSLSEGSGPTYEHWPSLVQNYTQSDLTKQSDRLTAFSGIARQLAPFEGQYVAGLWAKSLPRELLWQVSRRQPKQWHSKATKEYYAPTFSWASADCEVHVQSFHKGELDMATASFIKHRVKHVSSAATEKLVAGHVFGPLTAPIVEVRLRGILRSCWRVSHNRIVPTESPLNKTLLPSPSHACLLSNIRSCRESSKGIRVAYDNIGDEYAAIDSTKYYYTILSYERMRPSHRRYICAYGLLLKSVDESMARFARVGFVKHECSKDTYVDIRAPLGNERDLPAWNYDEATGGHTFYVV